jgi:hypothetical protein
LADAFSHDLTREIRHHLVGRLRLARPLTLKSRLLEVYRVAKLMPELRHRQRLIACNLSVYLLSRLVIDSEWILLDLLHHESDSFLRESILWALCHRGSAAALGQFFESMEADPHWRAECRGYVLYYYGDLRQDEGPPYYDDPPYRSCTNSRRSIISMFDRSNYIKDVPAERRAIDLYTFLDLLMVRREVVSADDIQILRNLIESLRAHGLADTLTARLQEMLASLASLA